MVKNFIAVLFGDIMLQRFNVSITKLNNLTRFHTHHVIMVIAFSDLKHRVTALKIMPDD